MKVCRIVFVSSLEEGTSKVLVNGVYEDVKWWGCSDEKVQRHGQNLSWLIYMKMDCKR